jgi:hypothetical protein
MMGPPKSSLTVRSTPVDDSFTAVDRTALRMQVRQPLGEHLDPRCCSAIEAVARHEDKLPGAVRLAMTLGSTMLPRSQYQRLGLQRLPAMKHATARLPMPVRPAIPRFDEIVIEFDPAGRRRRRGASVEIGRFVPAPRGR